MSTLKYETALALKEAGFPQPERWGTVLENCTCGSTEFLGGNKVHAPNSNCILMAPTLDELIEACGEELLNLRHEYDEKTKYNVWHALGTDSLILTAPTPTEAVANLYLALHGKNK